MMKKPRLRRIKDMTLLRYGASVCFVYWGLLVHCVGEQKFRIPCFAIISMAITTDCCYA